MAKLLLLLGLAAVILLWLAGRKGRQMSAAQARALLGVPRDAGEAEIREAHRRLIARVHPDAGGSQELAARVNLARDLLVAEAKRRLPNDH